MPCLHLYDICSFIRCLYLYDICSFDAYIIYMICSFIISLYPYDICSYHALIIYMICSFIRCLHLYDLCSFHTFIYMIFLPLDAYISMTFVRTMLVSLWPCQEEYEFSCRGRETSRSCGKPSEDLSPETLPRYAGI